jgi:hypothetical protein
MFKIVSINPRKKRDSSLWVEKVVEAGQIGDRAAVEAEDRGKVQVVWAGHLLLAQVDIVFAPVVDIKKNTSPENHAIVRSALNAALK